MNAKKPSINLILLNKSWVQISSDWKKEVSWALEKTAAIVGKDFSHTEVSVVFSDNQEVHKLNSTFRHKDNPTNVLSFPSEEKGELGDIILAYETILEEAKKDEISPLDHTLHLIIHGFLHLLGYDHQEENDAVEMENLELHILKTLNISNPYEER